MVYISKEKRANLDSAAIIKSARTGETAEALSKLKTLDIIGDFILRLFVEKLMDMTVDEYTTQRETNDKKRCSGKSSVPAQGTENLIIMVILILEECCEYVSLLQ
uniref:Uncharacterized protein N19B2.170 n=1 Tax=Trypanosoma brucei TaxID=5691 RepID=Q8WPP6_9TRYP|nr:hypothetical protein [Trypanosoma brucei]